MSIRSYIDHNATSPLRGEAREAMIDAFDRAGNPSSIHAEVREARAIIENARETVARIFDGRYRAVLGRSGKNLPWARGASRGVGLRNARNGYDKSEE